MATLLDVNVVKYLCSCGKWEPLCRLYLCRHCQKLRSGDCVLHEVDSPYCPNCLENMPSSEAKLKKNRCTNCFDCPSCGHTLTTRATSQIVSDAEDPNKSAPKKMYYMACGFCRWTTRDVGISDKSVASGAWEDLENPHSRRIHSLLDFYHQVAQREKADKERKKYVRRRSHLIFAASMDKYGLTSVAAKRKSLLSSVSGISIKENEETNICSLEPVEAVDDFEPLPNNIFTDPLQLEKVSTISQRLASPEFQPAMATDLYPNHKHLLIRHSLRCKECEHNLSKPEFNPLSIKFKIQLIALNHVPEIRFMKPKELPFKKEIKVVLTVCNPATYNTKLQLLPLEEESAVNSNTKLELPKKEIVLAPRDDSAIYDDNSHTQHGIKDDSSVVAFRKANKVGIFIKVTPLQQDEDAKVCFWLKHEYRNTTMALPNENQEPQIVWLQHKVVINLGPPHKTK
ncbi:hypothetical protein ACJMK2_033907 [Sinanodonta woodiana]|uniref:Dynactin subunit 4 n=1 Tax=Sinanodonta woodiana TaxID=1069815 RepID=A0ABD3WS13_SINWO